MIKEKENIGLTLVIALLLAVGVFLFFHYRLPYHLFMKEQIQLFLLTPDYLLSYLSKPAWLACVVGDFLTQFFYLRGGGALVLTLLLLLEWVLISQLLARYGTKWFVPLFALFPVAAEWIMHTQLNYQVSHTVSLMIVLSAVYLYTFIKKPKISVATGLLFSLLLYACAGSASLLFPVLVIFFDLYKRRLRLIYWGGLLLISIALPLLMRSTYLLTPGQVWLYPFTAVRQLLPLYVFLASLLLMFVKPVRKMWRGLTRALLLYGLFLLFLVAGLLYHTDKEREQILGLSTESYLGNWNRVDHIVNAENRKHDVATYYTNLSLAGKDEMGDKLLEYYQPMANGLFIPVGPGSSWLSIFFSGDVFFHLGDMNMAQHSSMLGMIFSPNNRSSRMVKRLAEINLINGDSTATRKYLRMLDATLFHRKWAKERAAMLVNTDSAAYPWLQQKRALLPVQDMLRFPSDYYASLRMLLDSNPLNKPALDYLLCYALLQKDLSTFVADYNTYAKGVWNTLPKVYAEALLIHLVTAKASEKVMKSYHIPPLIVSEFAEYTRLFEENDGRIEALQERYGTTYWFYFHYAQMKEK